MSTTTKPEEIVGSSDEEIDAIIAEFGGDPKNSDPSTLARFD